ncbi:MAG: porin [Pseudomonadota bacterium]
MKKSLLALAVLGVFAGAASAQSSVTLFGIVDVNARYVKHGNTDAVKQLGTDGINSSRLGFRGVEDLGGGLKAGFWIEGAMSPDTGAAAQTWQRRSTVSLMGGFGEVRLGRDYTPTFWNLTVFDPFGTNGVGSSLNLFVAPAALATSVFTGSGAATLVRASNTIGYFLPSGIGGLYGQVQVAAGEGVTGNKYMGGRIGYAAGPVDVAFAYGQTQVGSDDKLKTWNLGASYNLGVAKLTGFYSNANSDFFGGVDGVDVTQTNWMLGAVVPMGQGEIHASYNKASGKDDADGLSAKQLAVGYVYNLSKRTALYAQYSRITNELTAFSVTAGSVAAFDDKSSGAEFGIRHSF